ncbi:hypothetical protein AWZ03_004920 [Drosophila navojoa]|uniref:Uncharacterized protein n=1 Tax=Drosophila navojoa TaxID=7232 RepID=A0A484BLH4_DRONA|nr:hypothetical protein AWZ03_004920 [Drosophila navojoa]
MPNNSKNEKDTTLCCGSSIFSCLSPSLGLGLSLILDQGRGSALVNPFANVNGTLMDVPPEPEPQPQPQPQPEPLQVESLELMPQPQPQPQPQPGDGDSWQLHAVKSCTNFMLLL